MENNDKLLEETKLLKEKCKKYINVDLNWYQELLDLFYEGKFDVVKEKIEYYKENNPEYDTDIIEFNLMLRDGKHNRDECYSWLYKQKNKKEQKFYEEHGFMINNDFNYLYPELICSLDVKNMKKNQLTVEFYINPHRTYEEHNVNILKECLTEWLKKENTREDSRFYPFKDDEFKYKVEYVEVKEGEEIAVFHCYTTYDWIGKHNLYDDLKGLISFFE